MKNLFVTCLAVMALVLVSCNKNQAAVKKLDGTWTATEMMFSEGGLSLDLIDLGGSGSFTFNSCKLKKDEWCTGSSTLTTPALLGGATETTSQLYRVIEDGTKMEMKESDTSTATIITIVSLTEESLEMTFTDDGADVSVKATK